MTDLKSEAKFLWAGCATLFLMMLLAIAVKA